MVGSLCSVRNNTQRGPVFAPAWRQTGNVENETTLTLALSVPLSVGEGCSWDEGMGNTSAPFP